MSISRKQFMSDFEHSFPNLDHTKLYYPNGLFDSYKDYNTQRVWMGWVSSFETYSNGYLTGEYNEPPKTNNLRKGD
jgi:hypothetical protein